MRVLNVFGILMLNCFMAQLKNYTTTKSQEFFIAYVQYEHVT